MLSRFGLRAVLAPVRRVSVTRTAVRPMYAMAKETTCMHVTRSYDVTVSRLAKKVALLTVSAVVRSPLTTRSRRVLCAFSPAV